MGEDSGSQDVPDPSWLIGSDKSVVECMLSIMLIPVVSGFMPVILLLGFLPGMALDGAGIFIGMACFLASSLPAGGIVIPGMVWASAGDTSREARIAAEVFKYFIGLG